LLGRLIATAAALVALVAAVALAGYGVLLWIAIRSSDTATSSLFLAGLALVVAGAGLALLAWLLLRWGPSQTAGAGGTTHRQCKNRPPENIPGGSYAAVVHPRPTGRGPEPVKAL
jgi:hypothetical protein